jgi:hypothetical protein
MMLALLMSPGAVQAQAPSYGTPANDPAKSEGDIRIGLITPRVSLLGGGGTPTQEVAALQKNVSSYLTGPRIGTVNIKSLLDSLALEEGKDRQCDYVLYTSLTRKRQQSSANAYASGTKTGDEFTLGYRLVATDGVHKGTTNTAKATVTSDGEDVVTGMVETAAENIVSVAKAGRPTPAPTTTSAVTGQPQNTEPAVPVAHPTPAATPNAHPTGYGSLMAPTRTATTATVTDPPKAADAIRIGIVTPRTSVVGGGAASTQEAEALRQTMTSFLAGSTIETIELKARLDSLALSEGKKRECDYVLYTTLVRKTTAHSSGSGPSIGSIMGGVGGTGVGNKVPRGVTTGMSSVSTTIGALTKAKDEISFEFKLMAIDGTPHTVAGSVAKAKAKTDGEDILTPLIEIAAQAIVDVTKKN